MGQILMQRKKYEPKFIVSTFKNDAMGFGFLLLAFAVVKFAPFSFVIKAAIVLFILFFGFLFIAMNGPALIKKAVVFSKSLRNVSYYDPRMNNFLDVVMIKNNTAIRKDGSLIAYLKIYPTDLSIKSSHEQQAIVSAYRQFLNSIGDHIQIISRSVPVDLDTWLYNSETKISKRPENRANNLKRFDEFQKWINGIVGNGLIRNRVFYIVIRYNASNLLQEKASIKQFFKELAGVQQTSQNTDLTKLRIALKELDDRVLNYTSILLKMGVDVERLNDNQILSMFSGYSNDIEGIDTNYITPMMWGVDK